LAENDGVSPVYAFRVIGDTDEPLFDVVRDDVIVYVPPRRYTVSPAAALANAIEMEQGVEMLVELAQVAEPDGEV
jgi:hypothetical protein